MRILLFGKTGMLGSAFTDLLKKEADIQLFAFDQNEIDIMNKAALKKAFWEISPEMVINCAAYTDTDDAENNQEIAMAVNAYAVEEIAKLCEERGAILIHFSTDYVFDGNSTIGYKENDKPNPLNVYGKSKFFGEKAIQENCQGYYIIRTSWLFGPNGENFVKTMLDLFKKGGIVRVVADQVGCPTYTYDLADSVINLFVKNQPDFGIYHITNSGHVSWHEFAKEIFVQISKKDATISMDLQKVNSQDYHQLAKRPACSILLSTKTKPLRSFQEALRDYLVNCC